MNEQLQGKLVEILTNIQEAARVSGDFAMAQLPDIAQSYVAYGRAVAVAKSLVLFLFGLVLLGYSFWAWRNPWNHYIWDKESKRSESNIAAICIPAAIGSFLCVGSVLNFNYLVWFAPKVWLLKEIAGLLK